MHSVLVLIPLEASRSNILLKRDCLVIDILINAYSYQITLTPALPPSSRKKKK